MTRKLSDNSLTGDFRNQFTPIPAGGFVITFDQSADGSRMVHGADVGCGGWVRDTTDTKWRSLMTSASLQAAEYDPFPAGVTIVDSLGMSGLRIAPSDKNIVYAVWNSRLYKSTDGGTTMLRAGTALFAVATNTGPQRLANRALDIHPTDAATLIIGTNHNAADVTKSGTFYSTNSGATTTKITGLSVAVDRGGQPGRNLVAIDPGNANYVYVHVDGVGLYGSTTGVAGTFSAISGSPARALHLLVSASGKVYIAAGGTESGGSATNDLYTRTRAGTAASFTTGVQQGAVSVAVNPSNESHIVVGDPNGHFGCSYNAGTAWTLYDDYNGQVKRTTGETAWLSNYGNASFFVCMLQFDSTVANKLWAVHGTGVAWCNAPTAPGGVLDWHDYSNGNAEKVTRSFLSVAGKKEPLLGNWDYCFWKMRDLDNPTNTPLQPPLTGGNGLCIASDMDGAINDPNFIVIAIAQADASNAQSTTFGDSLTTIPGQTGFGPGGAIAVSNKTNIVILETYNGKGHVTKDGGTTWANIQLTPGADTINFIFDQSVDRRCLTADKQRAGVFSLVYRNQKSDNTLGEPNAGLWTSLDGGTTWTKMRAGVIGSSISGYAGDQRQFYQCLLRYVPGFSGEMLYTGCPGDETGSMNPLVWLKSDGVTEERLGATVSNVINFDFGPHAPGQTRPSVAFYGRVGGVKGLYLSLDWFATTPILLSRFPLDNLSPVAVVGCDRNIFGRVFAGGIGWTHFTYGKRFKVKGA